MKSYEWFLFIISQNNFFRITEICYLFPHCFLLLQYVDCDIIVYLISS